MYFKKYLTRSVLCCVFAFHFLPAIAAQSLIGSVVNPLVRAKTYFAQQSAQRSERRGDKAGEAENFTLAITYYKKAVTTRQRIGLGGQAATMGLLYEKLAHAYEKNGDYFLALWAYEQAKKYLKGVSAFHEKLPAISAAIKSMRQADRIEQAMVAAKRREQQEANADAETINKKL